MKPRIIFVGVDDTLIRSARNKRIPLPGVVEQVRFLHAESATSYLWSSGGDEYAGRRPTNSVSRTFRGLFAQAGCPYGRPDGSRVAVLLPIREEA